MAMLYKEKTNAGTLQLRAHTLRKNVIESPPPTCNKWYLPKMCFFYGHFGMESVPHPYNFQKLIQLFDLGNNTLHN